MAISVAKHYGYSDLTSVNDPLRMLQSIDYSLQDQMEFSVTAIDENIARNIYNTNDLQDYVEQSITFPESKDPWTADFTKSGMAESTIETNEATTGVALQQQPQQGSRKRRMDWDPLELSNGHNNNNGASDTKLALLTNGVDGQKPNGDQRRSVKTDGATTSNNGRIGWTDDIDFDLNGELSNNGYLNNEAFLSLSSAFTILKHEIPSPSSDQQKTAANANKSAASQDAGIGHQEVPNNNNHQVQCADIVATSNGNSNSNTGNEQSQQMAQSQPNGGAVIKQQQQPPQQHQQNGGPFDPAQLLNPNNIVCDSPPLLENANYKPEKSSSEHSKFQYVLAASTSIATKSNEDTLTYLNQGQSYEIKLKKLGDLSPYRGKILKSVIKICFHERRLQYMEREQMLQWQMSRPGERIVEIDVPLSYGLCQVAQPNSPNLLNTVEVLWDPMKEVGVYIQVNCISTEFTPKKHGGEKGVPFRIQVETYLERDSGGGAGGAGGASSNGLAGGCAATSPATDALPLKLIHAAACQIKVFKLKGADRKHKQDREKIQKRTPSEQEKYQPSYECTILTDIPNESIAPQICHSPEHVVPPMSNRSSGNVSPYKPTNAPSPGQQLEVVYDQPLFGKSNANNPIGINSVSSSNSNVKNIDQNTRSPLHNDVEDYTTLTISKDLTPAQLVQWMNQHRLGQHMSTFTHFSGADLLRMSKEDIIQICGVADGIRMYNTIHLKAITPRLTIFVSFDGSLYHAIYLHANTTIELAQKLCKLPGFSDYISPSSITTNGNANEPNVFTAWNIQSKYSGSSSSPTMNNHMDALATKLSVYVNGPSGIHVLLTDEVLHNIKDDSLFALDVQGSKVLMKAVYKNEPSN